MNMRTKTITLSLEDWAAIVDAVSTAQDKGPDGMGWKSADLNRAESAMNRALDAAAIGEHRTSNIEHRTLNIEGKRMKRKSFSRKGAETQREEMNL